MKFLSTILLSFLFVACSSSTGKFEEVPEGAEEAEDVVMEEKPAVCVWDKISVREEPNSKAKWVTSISLGESITFLGASAIDSTDKNREYIKVQLADGTEGWSLSDFIVIDSEVAVFLDESSVYKRPDLLTKTEDVFKKFGIVAIANSEGDWLEVVGERADGKWIQKGWVKGANLSKDAIDVAVAKFAGQALDKESDEEKTEALKEILENSDLLNSQFIDDINRILNEMSSAEEMDSMEEPDSVTVSE